jgi:predicted metalloprotease
MKWQGRRGSSNIEDRRRMGGGGFGGGRGMAVGGGGPGRRGDRADRHVLRAWTARDAGRRRRGRLRQGASQEITRPTSRRRSSCPSRWPIRRRSGPGIFQEQLGPAYEPVTLVLFKGSPSRPAGGASAQTGPVLLPGGQKVYLDTDFFVTLERQLGAGATSRRPMSWRTRSGTTCRTSSASCRAQRGPQQGADSAAVRVELQADCFSGVWAYYAQERLGHARDG